MEYLIEDIVKPASTTAYALEQSLLVYNNAAKLAVSTFSISARNEVMPGDRGHTDHSAFTINAIALTATITTVLPTDLARPITVSQSRLSGRAGAKLEAVLTEILDREEEDGFITCLLSIQWSHGVPTYLRLINSNGPYHSVRMHINRWQGASCLNRPMVRSQIGRSVYQPP